MERVSIVVVDDQAETLDLVREVLKDPAYDVQTFSDPLAALGALREARADIVLTDLQMPGQDGLQVLSAVKSQSPETEVILLTAYGDIEVAVKAMKAGATDFFTKPLRVDQLKTVVARLAELQTMRRRLKDLAGDAVAPVGTGEAMQRVLSLARVVAETDSSVLILGETGAGKEVLADYIQRRSRRAQERFVKVNCSSLPETLLESELFGHERGAFTGASERRTGRFERAHGGTLFLDEIAELPVAMQVKLLRVIQTHEIERLGGTQPLAVDFRLIAATHRNLEALTAAGRFREDLYYRIHVFPITIPPLREHPEDIPVLAQHFLHRARLKLERGPTELHPEALRQLLRHSWPGNVRELENVLERACVLSRGAVLTPDLLLITATSLARPAPPSAPGAAPEATRAPPAAAPCAGTAAAAPPEVPSASPVPPSAFPEALLRAEDPLEEAEKLTLQLVLERCRWDFKQAATALKISRSTLYAKVARHGLATSSPEQDPGADGGC